MLALFNIVPKNKAGQRMPTTFFLYGPPEVPLFRRFYVMGRP
jgi:hypothetical protein